MEPWGIEPQSRCSQQSASTRVATDLLSVSAAACGRLRRTPSPQLNLATQPADSTVRLSRCLRFCNYRALSQNRAAAIRPRERSCAQLSIFCTLFTRPAYASTRREKVFPARSNPDRPQLSKNKLLYAPRPSMFAQLPVPRPCYAHATPMPRPATPGHLHSRCRETLISAQHNPPAELLNLHSKCRHSPNRCSH